jgi:hypothetical protein
MILPSLECIADVNRKAIAGALLQLGQFPVAGMTRFDIEIVMDRDQATPGQCINGNAELR